MTVAEFGTLIGDTLYDELGQEYHVYCVTTDGQAITVYCKDLKQGTIIATDLDNFMFRKP